MVNVTFEEKGNKLTLTLKGHAGYAEIGKDIVCASCSILAYTVASFVEEADRYGYFKSNPVIKLVSGDTEISCEPVDDLVTATKNIFVFAEQGYTLLANDYSQYVKLKQFGQPDEA